jgi:3-hydroxymyristoyl/3-hydroxydecanoyl-(acyl carrier protein) dehydratase
MSYSVLTAKLDNENAVVAQVTTDAGSPWFAGHFPGEPILPGIAQLNMVTECIERVLHKKLVLQNLARVKFKQLIRPGDVLDIRAVAGKKENNYTFTIQHNDNEVCSGRLILVPHKEQ